MPNLKRKEDDVFVEALEKWRELHSYEARWDNDTVIDWMIDNEHFGLEKRIVRRELLKKLARAQNKKRVRNAQGNRVKVYHSAMLPVTTPSGKVVQRQFWGERLTLDAAFAHASMNQRQKQTEGMCKSNHESAQDLNENNPKLSDNPIQLSFDFSYVTQPRRQPQVKVIPLDPPPAKKVGCDPKADGKKRKPR